LQEAPAGDYTAAVCPIALETKQESEILGAVAAIRLLPPGTLKKVEAIQAGLEGYRQLKTVKRPIKTTQFITLTLVTLLIIFAATWFGFHLAKTITVPLTELAQGTNRIAHGDYDFFIDMEGPDEIGTLVNAFNRMTADLKTSKARLDEAQREMAHTNRELERRRRYMEIVLRNVAAGVIAANAEGEITTINPSAERLLRLRAGSVMGRNWRSLLGDEERRMLDSLLAGLPPDGRGAVDRQLQINLGGESLTLMVHLSLLRDERGRDLGVVVVFEDLTELERAQRMAAWREVARRIAHEVKNPLTPIKLSAQRLVRRYQGKLGDDADVFDECTRTIITQVEELRRLVSEFSHFARLPMAKPAPADLADLVQEAVVFYRQAHPEVEFSLECESDIPIFDLDAKQMHRVLINLLENAVAAVAQTAPPQPVQVNLFYDDILKLVRLEVGDSGPGLTAQDKLHMFEPYFTTKKGGTGLGLAIASTIVTDHQGYIRVQDNVPNGARIIIELPVRNARENAANRIT
jgi:two-component system nitrogen regulation sensor histidine kinase NtrY